MQKSAISEEEKKGLKMKSRVKPTLYQIEWDGFKLSHWRIAPSRLKLYFFFLLWIGIIRSRGAAPISMIKMK